MPLSLRIHGFVFFLRLLVNVVSIKDKAAPHRQLFAIRKGAEAQAKGGSPVTVHNIIVGKLRTNAIVKATDSINVVPPPSIIHTRFEMFATLHHASSPWTIEQSTAHRNHSRAVERELARSEDCREGLQ
jgi:hypothetical protein